MNAKVAILKLGVQDRILFTDVTYSLGKLCEYVLSLFCYSLTVGRGCADWFKLRHTRATGTNAEVVLAQDASFQESVSLSSTYV